jgi:hypothetical protein
MADLIVRDAERHEVAFPARMRVAGEHSSQVRLSAAAPLRDSWIEVDVLDLSRGGFGLISPVYLPRMTLIQVQVFSPQSPTGEPMVEGVVRVRRVSMTDGRPAYLFGTSLEHSDGLAGRQLDALLVTLESQTQQAVQNEPEQVQDLRSNGSAGLHLGGQDA